MHEEEAFRKSFDQHLAKQILRYTRPYLKPLGIAVFALLVTTLTTNLFPVILAYAINGALVPKSEVALFERYRVLWLALGAFALVRIVGFVGRYGQAYLIEWIGQHILFDIRSDIFSKIQRLHIGFFDRTPVGRLLTRITSDVEAVNNFVTGGLVGLLSDLFMLAGIAVFMLVMDYRLALVVFALVPLSLLVSAWIRLRMREAYRRMRLRLARVNATLNENLTGVQTTQLFVQEVRQEDRFDYLNAGLKEAWLDIIHWMALFYPLVSVIGELALGLLIWYGGGQVIQQAVSIGVLVAFFDYARQMFQPLQDLADKFNIFQGAMASAERIFTLLDTEEEIQDKPDALAVKRFAGAISFEGVWFAYLPKGVKPRDVDWVLRDITFRVKPGERVALVGATGAGKTSTISLISRFYDVQRGRVTIDGHDVRDYRQRDLRRSVGLVLQDPFLFSGTVEDNLRLGDTSLTDERVREVCAFVGAAEFIEKLPQGYQAELFERGGGLSTGQKQLLALARAILHNPDILLILDEATSNVDSETEAGIQVALERVMEGRTSLIIAHRLSTVKYADRILVFRRGRLVEEGSHSELLEKGGYYAKLYELQYAGME